MPITHLLARAALASVIAICTVNRADGETATWLFRSDLECRWSIDGEPKGVLHPDDRIRIALDLGEHLIEAVPTAGGTRWEQVITVKDTTSQVLTISLLTPKAVPAGEPTAEGLSRAKAALRALADDLEACPEKLSNAHGNSKPNPKKPFDQPTFFSGPKNVVWDFSPSRGLPSPYTGYVEFSTYLFFRAPLDAFERFRRDYPIANFVPLPFPETAAGIAYEARGSRSEPRPSAARYEFDLGAGGLLLRKVLSRFSPDTPWERSEMGPPKVGCEADALRKAGIQLDTAK